MGRTLIAAATAVLFALAACTDPAAVTTSTTLSAEPDGRIVVLDGGDIATLDPDGSNRVEITTDGGDNQYFQPVWSPESRRLAWGGADDDGFHVGLAEDDGGERGRVDVGGFPFYLNWSPDGEQVGILHGGPGNTFDFELIDVDSMRSSVVDSGSPYYFSWSPDSDAVVVHVGGSRLEILDESADPTEIGPSSPNFLSPRWTPMGIFYVGPEGVMRRSQEGETTLVSESTGFVSVNPSPGGNLVAIHNLTDGGGLTVSAGAVAVEAPDTVSVVDVESGEVASVTDSLSVGSFWSPDGGSLMVLVVEEAQAVDILIWEEGESRVVATLEIPMSLLSQALAFFDQYAQSWQMWSPDSSAIVLPGRIGNEGGIWVIQVGGGDPVRISGGEWAAWSHG